VRHCEFIELQSAHSAQQLPSRAPRTADAALLSVSLNNFFVDLATC
jgi:hypothetical protein